jgi:hypothetical protein
MLFRKALFFVNFFFFLSLTANAAPVNFTFEVNMPGSSEFNGTINSNVIPGTYLYDQGFLDLKTVYYTIQVDFDADGSYTRVNGLEFIYSDNTYVDYFYADYISGPIAAAGSVSGTQVLEYNYGNTNLISESSQLRVGNQHSWLSFSRIDEWAVNPIDPMSNTDIGLAMNTYNDDGSAAGNIMINYVEIVDATPVPVPGTLLLMGSGLIGLVRFRRKIRN